MVHAGRALSTRKTAVSSDECFLDRRVFEMFVWFCGSLAIALVL